MQPLVTTQHDSDRSTHETQLAGYIAAEYECRTVRRQKQRRQDFDERGLAGAIWAKKPVDLTLLYLNGEVIQGSDGLASASCFVAAPERNGFDSDHGGSFTTNGSSRWLVQPPQFGRWSAARARATRGKPRAPARTRER